MHAGMQGALAARGEAGPESVVDCGVTIQKQRLVAGLQHDIFLDNAG